MNNNFTLLVLAAGFSKRYDEKLKQTEEIGPNGEFIIDYNILNAIKVGFKKVVFIIREETYETFNSTIGKRLKNKIKIDYIYQETRETRAWGTAHAILIAKEKINQKFLVINADDLYDLEAFKKAYKNLVKLNKNNCFTVGYKIMNTLTLNGKVKRGICITKWKNINDLIEKEVYIENGKIKSSDKTKIRKNTYVSMDMLGFNPSIFEYLENEFLLFLKDNNNIDKEFQITEVLNKLIKESKLQMTLIKTKSKWCGLTYHTDLELVKKTINNIK